MASLKTSSDLPVTTTANPFKYHTVESAKLMESTLASLEANGIDTDFLGERGDDARFILRGGLRLSTFAKSHVLLQLGGTATVAPIGMTPRTVTFLDTASSNSPGGYRAPPRADDGDEDRHEERHSSRTGASTGFGGGGGTPLRDRHARAPPISLTRTLVPRSPSTPRDRSVTSRRMGTTFASPPRPGKSSPG